jgi:hypothetical protein
MSNASAKVATADEKPVKVDLVGNRIHDRLCYNGDSGIDPANAASPKTLATVADLSKPGVSGVSAKAENERSPSVRQRHVGDSIRRRDAGGWTALYRKIG